MGKTTKSAEESKENRDEKLEMSCIVIDNSTSPKLKSLMVELTSITKTIEKDSIVQPLYDLHSNPKGSKFFFAGIMTTIQFLS